MSFTMGSTQLDRELTLKAQVFRFNHRGYNHQKFRDSRRHREREARKKLGDGVGVFCRIAMACDDLTFYTVHAEDLELQSSCADWKGYFDPETVKQWKEAINATFARHWTRLEVGNEGRLHAHVLAEANAPIQLSGQAVKTVHDLEGLARYLSKSALPVIDLVMGYYLEHKGNVPRTAWSQRIPQASTLAEKPVITVQEVSATREGHEAIASNIEPLSTSNTLSANSSIRTTAKRNIVNIAANITNKSMLSLNRQIKTESRSTCLKTQQMSTWDALSNRELSWYAVNWGISPPFTRFALHSGSG